MTDIPTALDNKPSNLRIKKNGPNMSRAYISWSNMKSRCLKPSHIAYERYAGKGITICDRWLGKDGFNNFYADMGERPKGMSLDRIDNDGNYEPSNCRWADARTQTLNRGIVASGNTGHMGVNRVKNGNFTAYVSSHHASICLGTYKNIEDAIQVRESGVIKYYEGGYMDIEEIYKRSNASHKEPLTFDEFKAAILSLLPDHRSKTQPDYMRFSPQYSMGWNGAINKMIENISVSTIDTTLRNFSGQTEGEGEEGL